MCANYGWPALTAPAFQQPSVDVSAMRIFCLISCGKYNSSSSCAYRLQSHNDTQRYDSVYYNRQERSDVGGLALQPASSEQLHISVSVQLSRQNARRVPRARACPGCFIRGRGRRAEGRQWGVVLAEGQKPPSHRIGDLGKRCEPPSGVQG